MVEFYTTSRYRYGSWKTRTCTLCIVNNRAEGGLATQGARASAGLVFTKIFWNITTSKPKVANWLSNHFDWLQFIAFIILRFSLSKMRPHGNGQQTIIYSNTRQYPYGCSSYMTLNIACLLHGLHVYVCTYTYFHDRAYSFEIIFLTSLRIYKNATGFRCNICATIYFPAWLIYGGLTLAVVFVQSIEARC